MILSDLFEALFYWHSRLARWILFLLATLVVVGLGSSGNLTGIGLVGAWSGIAIWFLLEAYFAIKAIHNGVDAKAFWLREPGD